MLKIKKYQLNEILVDDYPCHHDLKDNIISSLENHPDEMGRRTNVKATMTNYAWGTDNNKLNKLRIYFLNKIKKFFSIDPSFKRLTVSELWANIYNKGDCTINHTHGDHSNYCSFVYFLKSKWYYSPLIFTDSGKKIRPKEGRFVIFPSNIYHHVPVHRYDNQRITLSGNVSIVGGDTGMILRGPKGEYFGWVKN